ncbi:MAG: caspase family protein [Spirochaetia bacterium]|nr:caspase family protein [Spirochaetia bacterium]
MKIFLLLLLTSSLLFITSCELFTDEPTKGDVYYINVGIDYENNSDVNTLQGTVNDAEELHIALGSVIAKANRTGNGYRMIQAGPGYVGDETYNINSTPISNYPTKSNIESILTNLKAITHAEDLIIFTYSGHGYEYSGDLLLAKPGILASAESLNPATLLSWMAAIPGKKLVILDSCFSGMFVEESPSSTNTVLNNSIAAFFETYHSADTYGKPDLFVLTASAHTDSYEREFDSDVNHNHGFFSYALLEALGWDHPHSATLSSVTIDDPPAAKGGRITVDGLFKYIKKHQAIPSRLNLFTNWTEYQHPMTTGGPLDLVLFNL